MMDNQLKVFITVAKSHSFNKAASQLFISTPAVIKRIYALENRIKVILFNRTHNGITLTKAGESFYQDAVNLVAAYDQSINRAKTLADNKVTLRIGAGPLANGTQVGDFWLTISKNLPNLKFEFIPCACSLGNFNNFLDGINHEFDVVFSVYDPYLLKKFNLMATQISSSPIKLSVPLQNPLASKKTLTLEDLAGQTVAIVEQGEFKCFDEVRQMLNQDRQIKLQDISGIDLPTLNQCVENDWLFVSAEDWQTAHPMLSAKTVDWDFRLPFGLVYGKKHGKAVDQVLQYLKTTKV